jgi:DNA-binding MarR family transcriptional regulator
VKIFQNDRLTYRLNIVAQEAIAINDPIFIRETGFNLRELRVLRIICDNPGVSFADIAKMTGLERSLTSRLIQKLLKSDVISRENSPEDARVFMLTPTENGIEIRKKARDVSNRLETILTQPLTRSELDQLQSYLERLAGWVGSEEYSDHLEEASIALARGQTA